MAKAVQVRVRFSEQAVDREYLRKSLEALHMNVVAEAVRGEHYSEQQIEALLFHMKKKLL